MDELLTEFIAETQETLEALASVIVSWENDPEDRNRLDAVFRFFHTVKGSCGFLNLPRFERLSHAAEDVLSKIREGEATLDGVTINAVLAVMDRIAELCSAVAAGESLPHENDDVLIEALHNCLVRDQQEATAEVAEESAVVSVVAEATVRSQSGPRTIRLPLSLIDQLMNGVSDMVLSRNELSRKLRERGVDPELEVAFERLSSCVADMRDTISKTRMQRVERLFMAIPRMVRDLSRELGKSIELSLEGGEVEMDREMVEMVVDPLTHIVRNSIDHGIELPHERKAAGKSEEGHLSLSARQSGSQIVIEVTDDGRGIDVDAVVRKVIAAGYMSAQDAAGLTEQEKLELIFTPGLSTAKQVTAISGRGVGMDVVRANVERLGGLITLSNMPGRGLQISLRVPLTLTIIPGLILSAGGQQFAIPRSAVIEILHDNNAMLTLSHVGGAAVATIRGVRYSMVDLEDVIGLPALKQSGPRTVMIVRAASGLPYALCVASVENHEELVIRPAAPMVMATGVYAGMTLPDNGQPMLLLDAGGIAHVAQLPLEMDRTLLQSEADVAETEHTTHSALYFRELDGKQRVIRLALVDRVEDIAFDNFGVSAGRTFVRIDGRLLPSFHAVSRDRLDGQDYLTCLRLREGAQEVVYPIASIIDIHDVPDTLDMSVVYDHVAGLALIDGHQVEVIDGFALFASVSEDTPQEMRPLRCLINDAQDSWNREILAPLLRQAGYEVVLGVQGVMADDRTVILDTGGELTDALAGVAPIVSLRANSEPSGPNDTSIFRYDRAGLMQALAAVGKNRKSA
jgi:two-component system, chemotaxis family, sensor kinase CheA